MLYVSYTIFLQLRQRTKCYQERYKFDIVSLIYFAFTALAFEVKFTKYSLRPRSTSLVPMFSSTQFIVSNLIFRSLIHFELIFLYCDRQLSSFILLPVAFQFSHHHLLKRLFFFHCMFLALPLPMKQKCLPGV